MRVVRLFPSVSGFAAQAITDSGATALHPGYGFLSENVEFAGRCEAAGVAFLGPTTDTMNMFSLKHTARAIAEEAEVCTL